MEKKHIQVWYHILYIHSGPKHDAHFYCYNNLYTNFNKFSLFQRNMYDMMRTCLPLFCAVYCQMKLVEKRRKGKKVTYGIQTHTMLWPANVLPITPCGA